MSKWSVAVILAIAGIAIAKYWFHERDYSKYLEEAKGPHYYGKGSLKQDELTIHPFTIKVEDEVLVDLKNRLKNARITHVPLTDANDFWYGFNSHYLKEVRDYWLNKYDWKKQEKLLNTFKHYKTQIEGLQIHFIRAHPPAKKYKQVFPILLAHGWPGNVFEFYKIIPILSDPKAHGVDTDIAFEVVAPSIPGYGWSEAAHKRGLSQLATARIFTKLMHRLQHKQFYIQGGDWGSMITALMSKVYPESILGLHLNTVFATASEPYIFVYDFLASIFPKVFLSSPALQKSHSALSKLGTMFIESGYMHLQATRPDTVGTGLNDSPIGLAAYILEKFSVWTNTEHRNLPDGGLTKKYTLDELLTLVMIYWTNGNIANSQRYYREFFTDENLRVLMERYVPTPTAHASGMNEFFDKTPLEITRHLFNLTHYTELADVGHFAAFEEPEKLAKDIFSFVMSKWILTMVVAAAGIVIGKFLFHETDYSKYLEEARSSHYYGKGEQKQDELAIHPFTIKVEEDVLHDLKNRLKNARITHEPLTDANDFWYGFNPHYLKEVKDYWLNKYDWKKQEKLLNTFKHYKTQIEGLQIHFIRAHPPAKKYKQVFPILLAHGWPGNVFEFYKIIPILSDPKAHGVDTDIAFEVVAPSIPGYGWSEAAHKRGLSQLATARIFTKLMHRLQHKQYYLQGGDWGAMITSLITKIYPEDVLGIHRNTIVAPPTKPFVFFYDLLATAFPKLFLSSKELQKTHNALSTIGTTIVETGYTHIQATRPDTVGVGLNDSPIGLAAYILEKFAVWTNADHRNLPDGGLTKKYTLDELLTIVMIYWINGNIVHSQRYYREFFTDSNMKVIMERYVSTPSAHASGMNEFFDKTPVEISRHLFNLTHYTELEDVGHFAAFEEPEKLAKDIFSFVHSLQKK